MAKSHQGNNNQRVNVVSAPRSVRVAEAPAQQQQQTQVVETKESVQPVESDLEQKCAEFLGMRMVAQGLWEGRFHALLREVASEDANLALTLVTRLVEGFSTKRFFTPPRGYTAPARAFTLSQGVKDVVSIDAGSLSKPLVSLEHGPEALKAIRVIPSLLATLKPSVVTATRDADFVLRASPVAGADPIKLMLCNATIMAFSHSVGCIVLDTVAQDLVERTRSAVLKSTPGIKRPNASQVRDGVEAPGLARLVYVQNEVSLRVNCSHFSF